MSEEIMERFAPERLHRFIKGCMTSAGATERDATLVADVLNSADLRGKEAHGIARLKRYADGIRTGEINPNPQRKLVVDLPGIAVMDGDNGLGQPASIDAMDLAIAKAKVTGIGAAAVRQSNHFGIAGYYAMRARDQNMIGISVSNASPQVAPTHGAEAIFGTNPLAIAVPTGGKTPFILDMSTSAVPRGKLERMDWGDKPMPTGWAIDPEGNDATDIKTLINGLKKHLGFALLPLGGAGELFGGHKGYSLGIVVDLLSGPLAGADWGKNTYGKKGANLGHFFIAMNVDAFVPGGEFPGRMEQLIDELHATRKAKGAERIYVPGEKSNEREQQCRKEGIPLCEAVCKDLEKLSKAYGVEL